MAAVIPFDIYKSLAAVAVTLSLTGSSSCWSRNNNLTSNWDTPRWICKLRIAANCSPPSLSCRWDDAPERKRWKFFTYSRQVSRRVGQLTQFDRNLDGQIAEFISWLAVPCSRVAVQLHKTLQVTLHFPRPAEGFLCEPDKVVDDQQIVIHTIITAGDKSPELFVWREKYLSAEKSITTAHTLQINGIDEKLRLHCQFTQTLFSLLPQVT